MVEAIILAAGLSKRMGVDKMDLEISGQTVLHHILIQAAKSTLNKIIVVDRHRSRIDGLEELRSSHGCKVLSVINPKPEYGMSHSIKLGMAQISTGTDGAMILLADQVCLYYSVINILISESLKNPGKIIAPTIQGRRTTPVIFPSRLFTDLRRITGDKGGREILEMNWNMVKTVEFGDDYDDSDIDTMNDYLKIVSKLKL